MAQQTINIGSRPNSGDGDPLRTAFDKVNDNFNELYAGGVSTDLSGSVFGDDSTLLVDAVNNVIPSSVVSGTEATNWNTAYGWGDHTAGGYAPQTTTYTKTEVDSAISAVSLDGDFTGSVFGDDSTALVDGVSNKIVGPVDTASVDAVSLRTSATSIALGRDAGKTNQANLAVAIGPDAGETGQAVFTVAVGYGAGSIYQGMQSVGVGYSAGSNEQGSGATAIGAGAGAEYQGNDTVAVGASAGTHGQEDGAVAVGYGAATGDLIVSSYVSGGTGGAALVVNDTTGIYPGFRVRGTGFTTQTVVSVDSGTTLTLSSDASQTPTNDMFFLGGQGTDAIAIGKDAAAIEQSTSAIAIGKDAGKTTQGQLAIAIGHSAGLTAQNGFAVAIGTSAGLTNQSTKAVAVGDSAGSATQGEYSVAVGNLAGQTTQGANAVAVGRSAGVQVQGASAVAVGYLAGSATQGAQSIAIGEKAGETTQGAVAVAIGTQAGMTTQGLRAIAIGLQAAEITQAQDAIAIGPLAGYNNQGQSAIAIGANAGNVNQAARSIVINATGVAVNNIQEDSLVITPIRNAGGTHALEYNPTTGEVTYDTLGGGGYAFTNIGIGADDSTIRNISEGESFLILGGTGITTASDAEGNITITGVAQDFTFSSLTGTPTTLAGYGITDAATLNNIAPTGAVDFTGATSVDFTGATISGLSVSGLQSRGSVTGTTGSLADAAEADLDITGFKSYALLTITTDRAARVRLYVTAATRTADASRAEGVDPTSDAGLIAEVITTGAETVIISPGAYGFNLESSPTTTIPCRVTNKSGGTSTVQVDLNVVQLEA